MHMVVIILTVVGGIALWLIRAHQAAQAAGELVKWAGEGRSWLRRRRWLGNGEQAGEIADPKLAAAILMLDVVGAPDPEAGACPMRASPVGQALAGLLGATDENLDKLLIEARFRRAQGVERSLLLRVISEACDMTERRQLIDAITTAFGPDGVPPSRREELHSLTRGLGLES